MSNISSCSIASCSIASCSISSYPYVPGQRMLSFDKDPLYEDLLTDNSYKIVARLQESILAKNFELFKKIYEEEYINVLGIVDFFKFEEESNNWWFNSYSLCECSNKTDEPDRIHKYMYVRPCCCVNGKRYLTYLCAFNAGLKDAGYYYDTNPIGLTDKAVNTPIKNYLLEDGPIDLTYKQWFYEK